MQERTAGILDFFQRSSTDKTPQRQRLRTKTKRKSGRAFRDQEKMIEKMMRRAQGFANDNNFDEALKLFGKCKEFYIKNYGLNHPLTLDVNDGLCDTYYDYGEFLEDNGQLNKALGMFRRCLSLIDSFGYDDRTRQTFMYTYANARSAIERVEKKIAEKARRQENFFAVTSAKKNNALTHLPQEMWESIFNMNRPEKKLF